MLKSNVWEVMKATGKYGIHGAIDKTFQNTLSDVGGIVTGMMRGMGVTGKGKLDLKNASIFGVATRTLGFGIGRVGVTVAKPFMKLGYQVVANTGSSIVGFGGAAGKLGRGLGKTFLKEAKDGAEYSFLGYEARALTPHFIAAGAIGVGIAKGADNADFNTGMMTAINGMMDTQGVSVVPGSVNQSYTPLRQRGRKINNFNADGNLPLALHNRR